MTFELKCVESDITWRAIKIEISNPVSLSTIDVYASNDRADIEAKALSRVLPEYDVRIIWNARIKAAYKNGERVTLNDMHAFYNELTDKQYRSSLIKDSTTAEWV